MAKEEEKVEESKDIRELREVLSTVRQEVPGLLRDIVDPLKEILGLSMTEEQARAKAKAIAGFYKELLEAGIEKELAAKMTNDQFITPLAALQTIMERVESGRFKMGKEILKGVEGK